MHSQCCEIVDPRQCQCIPAAWSLPLRGVSQNNPQGAPLLLLLLLLQLLLPSLLLPPVRCTQLLLTVPTTTLPPSCSSATAPPLPRLSLTATRFTPGRPDMLMDFNISKVSLSTCTGETYRVICWLQHMLAATSADCCRQPQYVHKQKCARTPAATQVKSALAIGPMTKVHNYF